MIYIAGVTDSLVLHEKIETDLSPWNYICFKLPPVGLRRNRSLSHVLICSSLDASFRSRILGARDMVRSGCLADGATLQAGSLRSGARTQIVDPGEQTCPTL